MSKYIFSIFLVFCISFAQAQTIDSIAVSRRFRENNSFTEKKVSTPEKKVDSIPVKTDRYGLRVGVDLYHLTRGIFDDNFKGAEFVADLRLSKRMYLAGEFGYENITINDETTNFTTNGSYYKLGLDYNTYENWLNMENILSLGFRYGMSSFSQTLDGYDIYNRNHYFDENNTVVSGQQFSGLSAHWIEFVLGVKAKVFNNVFLGFSTRLNHLVYNKEPQGFENLYIPGFNRTYNGGFGVGFNYSVSYLIPFYKAKQSLKK
ncbi:MAG: DUF6048 family protein [Flavobacterium sp.]